MKRLLAVLASLAVGCSAAGAGDGDGAASSDDALTTAPAYYVLARVNHTKNAGDAFVAPANGGTMTCKGGNTAASCLATLDLGGVTGADGAKLGADEAAAATASFLAGALVVEGTFAKNSNVLTATKAWAAAGTATASADKLWLVTPSGAGFHDRELGSTYARTASSLDLGRLGLSADAEASARAAVAAGGLVVRGAHAGGVLGADALYTPVAHASAPAPAPGNDLGADQQATALHDIDSTCGDTWCDGDYDFRFDTLTCAFATGACTIGLEVTYPNDGSPNEPWYARTCALSGFHAYADLVTVVSPTYSTITQALNDAMYDCTQTVEASVPK